MIAQLEPPEVPTLDSLRAELGDIPGWRILLRPPPGTATEADVLRLLDSPRKRICELIDGTLVEKAMGFRESIVGASLASRLTVFVDERDLGFVSGSDGTLKLESGRIRIPDVAFFSWSRVPGGRVPAEPVPKITPDLAVEVLSAGNTRREMELKREDLFGAGTKLIWLVDPRLRTVRVYTDVEAFTELTEADTLDGGAVLPGFAVPVKALFAKLERGE